jgi:hypothetical protein
VKARDAFVQVHSHVVDRIDQHLFPPPRQLMRVHLVLGKKNREGGGESGREGVGK